VSRSYSSEEEEGSSKDYDGSRHNRNHCEACGGHSSKTSVVGLAHSH